MKWVGRRLPIFVFALVLLGTSAVSAEEIRPEADLTISKTVSDSQALPGDTLIYTLVVTNQGPFAAAAVVATDTLPPGVTLVSASACTGTAVLECSAGLLFAGDSASFSITVRVDQDASATLTNSASVENREDPVTGPVDPNPENNTDSATTTVTTPTTTTTTTTSTTTTSTTTTSTTTTTTTTEAPVPGSIGDTVWQDDNKNGQQDAGEPGIAGVVVVLGGPGGTSSATTDGDGKYLFADLLQGTYMVALDPETVPAGFASTTPPALSVDLGNGEDYLDADFGLAPPVDGPAADLSIVKTASSSLVTVGEDITFTITVENDGPSDATGVIVGDLLTADLAFVSANPAAAYDAPTGLWTVGAIASGSQATLQITATVLEAGRLSNSAEVTASDQEDPDSVPDDGFGDDFTEITFQSVDVAASALIGDTVFLDNDGDGTQDSGEAGIAGVTVVLIPGDGSASTTQVTGSDGKYLFAGLDAGDYTVQVDVASVGPGLVLTTVGSFSVVLRDDSSFLDADFGFVPGTTTTAAPGDSLPRTGFSTAWLVVVGLALLLAGAFAVATTRR